jgi:hypothetical protein
MNLPGGRDECSCHQVGPVKAWTANEHGKPNSLHTSTIKITQIRADARNSLCCSASIPGASIKTLHSQIEVL